MTGQQLFLLISTFIVGMVAGFYVYITSFAPQYANSDVKEVDAELTIIGEATGGCQMGGVCESFQLSSNRRLSYIPGHSFNEDTPDPLVSSISRAEYLSLLGTLRAADFRDLKKPNNICNSASDGFDYVYNITLDGISYEMNSCGTKFNQSELFRELLGLWPDSNELSKPESLNNNDKGAADLLIERFGAE